jgi:hypothetical protein
VEVYSLLSITFFGFCFRIYICLVCIHACDRSTPYQFRRQSFLPSSAI